MQYFYHCFALSLSLHCIGKRTAQYSVTAERMSANSEMIGTNNASTSMVREASSFLQTSGGKSVVVVLAVVIVAVLLDRFLSAPKDAREPPVLRSTIPFVGHIINMIRHGNTFLTRLS